jgi:hypothetical protein
VFTQDPKPLYLCLLCGDSNTHSFSRLESHLSIRHDVHSDSVKQIRGHFKELPTTRPFVLFDYMYPIVDVWMKHPLIAWEKSRDMMATWLTITLYTWDTLFNNGRENIFQSETGPKTLDLVKRADFIYRNQPKWLKDVHPAEFSIGQNRAGSLYVPSLDSRIFGLPQGPDQIRMYHPTGLFSDEAAFQDQAGDCFAAIKPAIQNAGRYTAVSSANPGFFQLLAKDMLENY